MYFSIHFQLLPFYFAGGVDFGNVPPNETENRLESNATHRVSPAGRRSPAAGKLAVGAARRIGGDERGGA